MAWCGCSRKGRQSLASSGGGGAGWSVCTSTPYILWRRRSSKALRPFSGDVYGWVFCAKNWQLHVSALTHTHLTHASLNDAHLRNANLTGADVSGMSLDETYFICTTLTAVQG